MLEQEEKKEFLDAIQQVVSTEINKLSSRMDGFAVGQEELRDSVKSLEEGQRELRGSVKSLGEGQRELRGSVKSLEEGQQELRGSVKSLEEGQEEIHEMVQALAVHMDEKFEQVDQRFDRMDQRFDRLEGRVGRMEAGMVTKDYLDDKLAEHGYRYGEIDRKTNSKIELLTDSLVAEKSLSSTSAKRVTSSEPFARMK